jgi:hypothetical protein
VLHAGCVFRFIPKPCSIDTLRGHIETALVQHGLLCNERDLLENTLSGCVAILADALSMLDPTAFGSARRVKKYVDHIAATLDLPDAWQFGLAALLSRLGCVTIPGEILNKAYTHEALTENERGLLDSHARTGGELLGSVKRFETVSAIVATQDQSVPSDLSDNVKTWDRVATGRVILRLASDFDRLVTSGHTALDAVVRIKKDTPRLPPVLLEALRTIDLGNEPLEILTVSVKDLRPTMIFVEDVRTKTGVLLAARGQELTSALLRRLQGFAEGVGVTEPLTVRRVAVRSEAEAVAP